MTFLIRDFDRALDESAALSFIMGSQSYEHALEPNRRLDPAVAGEHYAELMSRVAARRGRIFVAEDNGSAIGWAVVFVEQSMIFVVEAERTFAYIAEVFVVEAARGHGAGQALIAACEDHARALGLGHVMIGVLAKNARAADIYARAGYAPYSMELRKYL